MKFKNGYQKVSDFVKVANEVVPHLKNLVKSMGDDKIKEALATPESMKVFSLNLYQKLPKHVQMKCNYETFETVIVSNRERLMKKKSNQKKVFGKVIKKEETPKDE
jgi:hypothetical protein